MRLHLYRPLTLWRGGESVYVYDPQDMTAREVALCVALELATWVAEHSLRHQA